MNKGTKKRQRQKLPTDLFYTPKHIELAIQGSAIDLVEQLAPNKCIEDECVMSRILIVFLLNYMSWFESPYIWAFEEEDHNNN